MSQMEHIEIPTPFGIGTVNCYLLDGEELTLIDPGPATEPSFAALDEVLDQLGHDAGDIENILVTHAHMDHYGSVGQLKDQSGASVFAHKRASRILADPVEHFDRERAFFPQYLVSMGVPERMAMAATNVPEPYFAFQEPVTVDRELADGDHIDVGPELAAVHTPGHSQGSICFTASVDGYVFTGDHLLNEITPNPGLSVGVGPDSGRTRGLPVYMASLEKLRSLAVETGYAGHGNAITDVETRIDETLAHHRERKEEVADILADSGPMTPYAIMLEMFSQLPITELFLGMSEVIGHLDLLEDEDRIVIVEADGVSRYRLRE
jgi:glyoxylase-like metal-dependent hydrolase (beta-lactamase superfamily II)